MENRSLSVWYMEHHSCRDLILQRGKLVVVRELNLVQEGFRFNISSQKLSKILNLSGLDEHPN